jgi:hypothetical protein
MAETPYVVGKLSVVEASRRFSRDLSHLEAEQKEIAGAASRAPEVPLCVDLDGTLVRTDLAWEPSRLVPSLRPGPQLRRFLPECGKKPGGLLASGPPAEL